MFQFLPSFAGYLISLKALLLYFILYQLSTFFIKFFLLVSILLKPSFHCFLLLQLTSLILLFSSFSSSSLHYFTFLWPVLKSPLDFRITLNCFSWTNLNLCKGNFAPFVSQPNCYIVASYQLLKAFFGVMVNLTSSQIPMWNYTEYSPISSKAKIVVPQY